MEVQRKKDQNKTSKQTFLNYSFFKIDPKWRWMNEVAKEEAAKEFATLVSVANTKLRVHTYTTLGLHNGTDFMLWMVSDSVEMFQTFTSKIYSTIIGKYIEPAFLFLSSYRRSVYSEKVTPSFLTESKPLKYLIVYPFVKSREWYLLPFEERKKMMDEHISIGRKFPESSADYPLLPRHAPINRIGTTQPVAMVIEDCSGTAADAVAAVRCRA